MNVRTALLAILLSAPAVPAAAATILVGPANPSPASPTRRLAKDGDTVLIRPGTYKGDVAVWAQKSLTIRGFGGRPVLDADGRDADGKGIWVFVNGNFKVENIEFRGARVADGNGAGIRFEQGSLEVRDCVFEDNQNGLITANFDTAELRIYNSSFSRAPREPGGCTPALRGAHQAFVLEGSRFHRATRASGQEPGRAQRDPLQPAGGRARRHGVVRAGVSGRRGGGGGGQRDRPERRQPQPGRRGLRRRKQPLAENRLRWPTTP
jgi:hypothetical protein